MLKNNETDDDRYVQGFIVGMFTVLIVFVPYIIALDVVSNLPPYFNVVGMLIWIGAFVYGFLRSILKVEKKLKRFFMVTLRTPPIEVKEVEEE